MAYILSQVLVVVSSLIYSISMLLPNKRGLLYMQIFSSSLCALHYFLLSAYIGGIVSALDSIRIVTFYFIDKKNNTDINRKIACASFIIIGLIGSYFTWESWFSIFPVISLIIVNTALALQNLKVLKISLNISILFVIAYMIFIKSYFGMATQIVVFVIGVIGAIRDIINTNKTKAIIY